MTRGRRPETSELASNCFSASKPPAAPVAITRILSKEMGLPVCTGLATRSAPGGAEPRSRGDGQPGQPGQQHGGPAEMDGWQLDFHRRQIFFRVRPSA